MGVGSVSQALVVVEAARLSTRQVHYVCGAVREFACRSAVCVLFMMWWRSIRSNYGICWFFCRFGFRKLCYIYFFNVLLDFYTFLKYSIYFFFLFCLSFLWFHSFFDSGLLLIFHFTYILFQNVAHFITKKYIPLPLPLFISISRHSFRPRIKKRKERLPYYLHIHHFSSLLPKPTAKA